MRRSKNRLSSKKNHRKKLTQIRKQSKREEENLSDSQTLLSICDKIKFCVCLFKSYFNKEKLLFVQIIIDHIDKIRTSSYVFYIYINSL
jgi:hypothetical protein